MATLRLCLHPTVGRKKKTPETANWRPSSFFWNSERSLISPLRMDSRPKSWRGRVGGMPLLNCSKLGSRTKPALRTPIVLTEHESTQKSSFDPDDNCLQEAQDQAFRLDLFCTAATDSTVEPVDEHLSSPDGAALATLASAVELPVTANVPVLPVGGLAEELAEILAAAEKKADEE
eukprot:m.617680 g.617680  ORF g.617680 m.617680 type:complete len:176 (-) comp58181_c0_seq21:202-729(-)